MSKQIDTEKEEAATERLLTLMTAHGMGQWAAGFREDMGDEDAREQWITANLSVAVYCARPALRRAGITMEELHAALMGEPATETAHRAMKRIGRAARLLERLVLPGANKIDTRLSQ